MNTTNTGSRSSQSEVITLPVGDVERALQFYVNQVVTFDVDYSPNDAFRVVQLTPPGSGCSIQIGRGLTDPSPRITSQRLSRGHRHRGRAETA
jgi:hypothetical protein